MITESVEDPKSTEARVLLSTLLERIDEIKRTIPREIAILGNLLNEAQHYPVEVQQILPGYERVFGRASEGQPCDPRNIMSRVGFLLVKKLRALAKKDRRRFEELVDAAWSQHEGTQDPLLARIKANRTKSSLDLERMSSADLEALGERIVYELSDRAVYFKDFEGNNGQDDNPVYHLSRTATLATSSLYRILFRYSRLRYVLEEDYMPIIISANRTRNKKELGEWEECVGWDSLMRHDRVRDPSLRTNQYLAELLKKLEWIRWFFTHPGQKEKLRPNPFERCVLGLPHFCEKSWKCWESFIWEMVLNESPGRCPENHPFLGELADNYGEGLEEQFDAQRKSGYRKGSLTSGEITDKIRKYIRNRLAEKVLQFAPATPRYR